MTDRDQLHHLADRARRGVLLPAEGALLADAVAVLEKRADQTEDLLRVAHETSNRSETERARAVTRADRTEATIAAFANIFEGFGNLLATSSRDWSTYRVDAWLWAIVCGWDCEETEHDATCVHGSMEEIAALHGWNADAVAKARRYRATVAALDQPQTPTEDVARQLPCSLWLVSNGHAPHWWQPQPGMADLFCPGAPRKDAATQPQPPTA